MNTKQNTAWPPMYKSFKRASIGRTPAVSLELITPDANITGHAQCDTHVLLTISELKDEHAKLFQDIKKEFEKRGASEQEATLYTNQDPDIALIQRALDTLS